MSTEMDKKGAKEYAKKMFWTMKVPQSTKPLLLKVLI